ncbi:MAG TPA: M23 family metallopeptidase [Stellaceae bacterium]|nr:M23 family metallopeptidase [Stellaceae bacterium]
MGKGIREHRGFIAAPAVVALAGWLAACAPAGGPAPVVYGGANRPPPAVVPGAPPPAAVVVQPGQSLSMIARTYHLAWPALAAANHLSPPYHLKPGQRLVIPGGRAYAAAPPAPVAVASLPPPAAAMPAPEKREPATTRPPRLIPLDASEGAAARDGRPTAAAKAPPAAAPRPSFARPIPLDNPTAPSAMRSRPSATREAAAEEHGAFLWPVRGSIVEGFGAGPGGTRNEGINIAAPQGAPVKAADAGVVVYVGNELRGYGNLILIKHAQGWISAYAHCGAVLVRRGDKVRRGQIIARIGATGNVQEPQLHFELRRGKKAVDPRPLLGQPGAAANRAEIPIAPARATATLGPRAG